MGTAETLGVRHMHPSSYARLMQDISELGLHRGEIGIVRGVVPGLTDAYEVEFHRRGGFTPLRTLLLANQLEPETGPLLGEADVARFQAC